MKSERGSEKPDGVGALPTGGTNLPVRGGIGGQERRNIQQPDAYGANRKVLDAYMLYVDSKRVLFDYLKPFTPLIEVSHAWKKVRFMGSW